MVRNNRSQQDGWKLADNEGRREWRKDSGRRADLRSKGGRCSLEIYQEWREHKGASESEGGGAGDDADKAGQRKPGDQEDVSVASCETCPNSCRAKRGA